MKHHTLVWVLFCLFSWTSTAFAQESNDTSSEEGSTVNAFIGPQLYFNNPGWTPAIWMNLGWQPHDVVGGNCFVSVSSAWGELLCGPTLSFFDGNLGFGFMGGLETIPDEDLPLRGAIYGFGAYKSFDIYAYYEDGIEGDWWHYVLARAGVAGTDEDTGWHAGLITERFLGEGLYFDIERGPIQVFVAGTYSFEDTFAADSNAMSGDYLRMKMGVTYFIN